MPGALPDFVESVGNQIRSLRYGGRGAPGFLSLLSHALLRKSRTQSLYRSLESTITACRVPQMSHTPMIPLPKTGGRSKSWSSSLGIVFPGPSWARFLRVPAGARSGEWGLPPEPVPSLSFHHFEPMLVSGA